LAIGNSNGLKFLDYLSRNPINILEIFHLGKPQTTTPDLIVECMVNYQNKV